MQSVIHWFRRDLRLTDNRALYAALESGSSVIPLFIFDPHIYQSERAGAARTAFLLNALTSLDQKLREFNSRLLIRFGQPLDVLKELIDETNATALYFNDDYAPYAVKRDKAVSEALNIPVQRFDDLLLLKPGEANKSDGDPYTVYTPFKKRWLALPKPEFEPNLPNGRFHALDGIDGRAIPTLHELGMPATIDVPDTSETAARRLLNGFMSGPIFRYSTGRNNLAADFNHDPQHGSSFLSPYFHLGLLSARQAYWMSRDTYKKAPGKIGQEAVETWVGELIWRDFYNHILFFFPHVKTYNFRREYNKLEWRHTADELQAWKEGMTGYPVIDAAMRQMNQIGWMPNRARMIVASFLSKHLLIDWREGERYFMQRLIDGDTAANNGGWQWAAGTGTDAQPYFRMFNPITQGIKFDPDGVYIRRWVPELRDTPAEHIHAPWEMTTPPPAYPAPLVDHAFARKRTLDAFESVR
jgi:deoxyribodipyrimidine photo-lyase